MRSVRRALPFVLIVIGVWLLNGCIYIPMFNHAVGKDARKYIGDASTSLPIRPGVSRETVRRVLGRPHFSTTDGRFLVYSWEKRKGVLIYPLCFWIPMPEDRSFAMTIEFDAAGKMSTFDVEEGRRTAYLSPLDGDRFVPFRVTYHQVELRVAHDPVKLEEVRATTRRAATQRARHGN